MSLLEMHLAVVFLTAFHCGVVLFVDRTSAGSLCVLATPRGGVCSLMHMCRSVVRSLVTTPDIPALPLPRGLHKYLAYKENSSDDSLAAGKNW